MIYLQISLIKIVNLLILLSVFVFRGNSCVSEKNFWSLFIVHHLRFWIIPATSTEKRKILKKNFSLLIKSTTLFNKTKSRNAFIIGTCMVECWRKRALDSVADATYLSRLACANKREQKLVVASPPVVTRLVWIYYCRTKSECIRFGGAQNKSMSDGKCERERETCLSNDFFQRLAKTDMALNFVFIRP